jgi:hypothetical protein
MFNSNQAFLLVQKLKLISPKGFTLGVKAEIEKKKISICPKLLINADHYGLYIGPKLEKKNTIEFGKPLCKPWGRPMFQHLSIYRIVNVLAFISKLRPNNKPKMLKVDPQGFSTPTPSVKWAS